MGTGEDPEDPDRKRAYVDRARVAIVGMLDEHHAVLPLELEARVSEGYFVSSKANIDPHHVGTALRELRDEGVITREKATSRGGHEVETIQPAEQRRRGTKIAQAAARRRLLASRYMGWSQGTKRHPRGLIGPAGEEAVRAAVLAAGSLQPINPDASEVKRLLGVQLPGSLDSGGVMVPFTSDGLPKQAVTVPIEVKNIRGWVYPRSPELHQLLNKAALAQLAQPDQLIVPILVCRKAHYTTFRMAKQFGFCVIEMNRQFAGEVDEEHLIEVRQEIAYRDLVRGVGPSLTVRDRLRKTLPGEVSDWAVNWRASCYAPGFTDLFAELRKKGLANRRRDTLTNQLRGLAADYDFPGGW